MTIKWYNETKLVRLICGRRAADFLGINHNLNCGCTAVFAGVSANDNMYNERISSVENHVSWAWGHSFLLMIYYQSAATFANRKTLSVESWGYTEMDESRNWITFFLCLYLIVSPAVYYCWPGKEKQLVCVCVCFICTAFILLLKFCSFSFN